MSTDHSVNEIASILLDEDADEASNINGYNSTDETVEFLERVHQSAKRAGLETKGKRVRGGADEDEDEDIPEDDDFDDEPREAASASRGHQGHEKQVPTFTGDVVPAEQINARKDWLAGELNQLRQALDTNQITPEQFKYGLDLVQNEVVRIQFAEANLAKWQAHMQAETTRIHNEIAERIPKWANPHDRAAIQSQMTNYLTEKGIPEQMIAAISHPSVVGFIYEAMRNEHSLRSSKAKLHKIKANSAAQARVDSAKNPRPNLGLAGQVDATAEVLRQAGLA